MHQVVGYHRPGSIAEAIGLLGAPNRIILSGGTTIRHDGGGTPVEVVDLQSLDLDGIDRDGETLTVGATCTLQTLVDNDAVPDLVRRTAKAELPSTLRTLATVGGTIGTADADSVLLAALLTHDAIVHFPDERSAPLEQVLRSGVSSAELIVGVTMSTGGTSTIASTGRTPGDIPIVAALGRVAEDTVRLALCGVAATPQLVAAGEIDRLEPPGDFRGSTEYRLHLARVLSTRVIEELS